MGNVIVRAEEVTPEWLTGVLCEQGALPQGKVTRVTPGNVEPTFGSCVWRLEVSYSEDAPPAAPKRLFLKVANPALVPGEVDPEQMHKETLFYHAIAPAMDGAFTIPCYDAAYEPETGASHILLKDVSETHAVCLTPSSQGNCERAVDALARLHAFWWDHPRVGRDVGRYPTQEERQHGWIDTERSTIAFLVALGDQVCPRWRATYESVLPALPSLFKRHATAAT